MSVFGNTPAEELIAYLNGLRARMSDAERQTAVVSVHKAATPEDCFMVGFRWVPDKDH